jgi:hydrogenase nickel incorporation protein HypA/HybF
MLMHETVVAQSLFETILAETKKQNAKPIIAKMSCGVLNAINDEVLRFAIEAITKGTICQGLKLEIEHKPMQGKCRSCNEVFDVDFHKSGCPKCKAEDFDLLPDAPLILEEIEFQTE